MSTEPLTDYILYSPDEKHTDQKSIFWRDESHSPASPSSESGLGSSTSSNSSVFGEEINAPARGHLTGSFIMLPQNHGFNGHKKLNRSQSEPRGRYNRHMSAVAAPSKYKTELCNSFSEFTKCKYGEKCQFAHGVAELREISRHPKYKTEMCRVYHSTGYCPYGPRCHFVHKSNLDSNADAVPLNDALPLELLESPVYPPACYSSLKDLSLSPNSVCSSPSSAYSFSGSLSPASSLHAFSFCSVISPASSLNAFPFGDFSCSPPPSPIESRLPIFNEISASTSPFAGQFGGLTA